MEIEKNLYSMLQKGKILLGCLEVSFCQFEARKERQYMDAILGLNFVNSPDIVKFAVGTKKQNTPKIIQEAIWQIQKSCSSDTHPMIIVPYLNEVQLDELYSQNISGIDLCGNGIVAISNKMYVRSRGYKNLYPGSRGLSNPYEGRSAQVAKMLLSIPYWQTLSDLQNEIVRRGGSISLAQVSKSVKALEQDLIIVRRGREIVLKNAQSLLDRLQESYRTPIKRPKRMLRMPQKINWATELNHIPKLSWVVSGESSVRHYGGLIENGPICIFVSELEPALQVLKSCGAEEEQILGYADFVLIENTEQENYFQIEVDLSEIHWASLIQTWLELQAGDARQLDAARGLRERILANTELKHDRW